MALDEAVEIARLINQWPGWIVMEIDQFERDVWSVLAYHEGADKRLSVTNYARFYADTPHEEPDGSFTI